MKAMAATIKDKIKLSLYLSGFVTSVIGRSQSSSSQMRNQPFKTTNSGHRLNKNVKNEAKNLHIFS